MEGKTILLVEDDLDEALLCVRALRKNGVSNEVVVARDGSEALDYLFGTGAMPEFVLLDLRLPKVDGLEVLRRLRQDERTRSLPVAVLTSSEEDRDLVEGHGLCANGYVRKPVEFDRFVEAVRQLRLHWLLLSEPPIGRGDATSGPA